MKLTIEEFDAVYTILEEAFPACERRPYEAQYQLLDHPNYHIHRQFEGGELAAVMAYWDLLDCLFIEHFASTAKMRGKGLGSRMMKKCCFHSSKCIVLEVEPPETAIAKRRIAFYQRLGFHLNEYDYLMPPLHASDSFLPLKIMSYPSALTPLAFKNIRTALYEYVYDVKKDIK